MRCDRLTAVIFRASGSKFASRSAPRRARFHHETASRHRAANHAKRAASAACSCASIVESRNTRYSLQNRLDRPLTVSRLLPLSQPRTRFTAPRIHPLETHPPRTMNQPLQPHHKLKPPTRPRPSCIPQPQNHHRLKLFFSTTRKPKPSRLPLLSQCLKITP